MGAYINAGKEYIKRVIESVREALTKKHGKEPSFTVGFVAYRDFGDGARQLVVTDLTTDTAAVCRAVDAETAGGGGDAPEDICGALHKARELSWRERSAKFIILICDCPCHNTTKKTFHSFGDNHVYERDPRGYLDPDDQLVYLRNYKNGIRVMITEMSTGYVTTMIDKFKVTTSAHVHRAL